MFLETNIKHKKLPLAVYSAGTHVVFLGAAEFDVETSGSLTIESAGAPPHLSQKEKMKIGST